MHKIPLYFIKYTKKNYKRMYKIPSYFKKLGYFSTLLITIKTLILHIYYINA